MYNQYNPEAKYYLPILESTVNVFKSFLYSEEISKGSIRSYVSDVRHFLGWLMFFSEANHVIENRTIDDRVSKVDVENRKLKVENLSSTFYSQPLSSPASAGSRHGGDTFNHLSSVVPLLKHVNSKVLDAYKDYLVNNNIPLKTINRRFSSLRRFGLFCQSQNWCSLNPFETLKNISLNQPFQEDKYHLAEYKSELWKKGTSKLTIKNYLADIKQFLAWVDSQPASNPANHK